MADAATAQQGTAGTPEADKGAAAAASAGSGTGTEAGKAVHAAAAATTTAATTAVAAGATADKGTTEAAADGGFKPWGHDWRQRYSGTDEKKLNMLSRYADPAKAFDALIAAQNRIAAGDVKNPLPENPTAEVLATWRKENGIPDAPEGYLEKLPNGLVIGDDDKEIVKDFLTSLHGANADPRVAHQALAWYNGFAEKQAAARAAADTTHTRETEDSLRATWGNEYHANINAVRNWVGTLPADAAAVVLNARGPDGRAIMNIPEVVSWFAQQAREINPVGTIVPAGTSAPGKAMESRIGEIEKMMRTDRKAYNKDEKVQAEYRQLIDAQSKMRARGAA